MSDDRRVIRTHKRAGVKVLEWEGGGILHHSVVLCSEGFGIEITWGCESPERALDLADQLAKSDIDTVVVEESKRRVQDVD